MRRRNTPEKRPLRKRVEAASMIGADSRRAWRNPLDQDDVMAVLKKTEYKNGLYNGYLGSMRLALQLMVKMMADPDPVIAQTAALNLMRSDGYSGLIGLPAIKATLQKVRYQMKSLRDEEEDRKAKEKAEEEAKAALAVIEGIEGDKPADDPLTAELLAQIMENEEDGTGSD